jgi:uncharacterized protein (DUF305 family)
MKLHLKLIAAAVLLAAPELATAQTEPHHPTDGTTPSQAQPMSPETMQTMMRMMQNCMGMMQMMQGMQMGGTMPMQGGMMGGDMPMQGSAGNMPMMQGSMSDAMAAYMAAMSKMDMPMMQAIQASDPDVAFVKGMIPHHQGAIDMANVELQYGTDPQLKSMAQMIIDAQQKEIADFQEWLAQHPAK